jgi:hypothetical protein
VIARYLFGRWTLVALAAVTVAVVVFPWTVAGPSVYHGFDGNLMYVDATKNARADFAGGRAVLTTAPGSQVTVDAVTTTDNLSSSFDVTVQQDATGNLSLPLGVRLWFPHIGTSLTGTSINVRFRDRQVVGSIFDGTQERMATVLGTYVSGQTYHVKVDWHKGAEGVIGIVGPDGTAMRYSADRSTGLLLFDERYVDFSLDSVAADGAQRVELSNFSLAIPAQTTFATKANDPRLIVVTTLIVLWFVAFAGYQLLNRRRLATLPTTAPAQSRSGWLRNPKTPGLLIVGTLAAIALYVVIAPVDGHPYDRLAQESYAYVSQSYGIGSLYDRTSTIPDAAVRGGHTPWSSPPFAYPPALAYTYWAAGGAWHIFGGVIAPLQNRAFQVFWKLAFALFVLVNAALIHRLARDAKDSRWAIVAVAIYVLNPAIIFDAVGWGETEAIVTSALLVSLLGFVTGRSRLGWSALVVAILLKQTALFALPVMAVYSVKKFGWTKTLESGSIGSLVGFCIFAPLVLAGYHPATIYKSIFAQVLNFANPSPVNASGDTYSIWTVVNGFTGLSGFDRILAPYALQVGGIGFSTLGTVAFLAVMLAVLWMLARSRADRLTNEMLYLSLSVVLVTYVVFSTLASARYLLLALPFLVLSLSSSTFRSRLWMIGGLTLVSFLSMYGVMMEIAVRGEWPDYFGLGNPSTNAFSNVIYQLYTSDVAITVLGLLLLILAEAQVVRLQAASHRSRAIPHAGLVAGETS